MFLFMCVCDQSHHVHTNSILKTLILLDLQCRCVRENILEYVTYLSIDEVKEREGGREGGREPLR